MSVDKITIVINTFKSEDKINHCLASINPDYKVIIVENSNIPVIVDAGIGSPSQAAEAMEIGSDGILANTAIAKAGHPHNMARAMKLGVIAGRMGYLAGQMETSEYAKPSSPTLGISKKG